MRKVFLFLSLVVIFYFTLGFYYATVDIELFSKLGERPTHPLFHDYHGVSHVITSYSKGSALPTDVLLSAGDADLDFLIFTDLNTIDRPYNISGYHGDVFTFSNQKVSYLDSHILVYSDNPDFYFDSLSSAHALLHQHFSEADPRNRSFMAVLAHPFKKNHQWTGEYPVGLDGIEVINMRHLWQHLWFTDRSTFVWSILTYPFNPKIALLRLIQNPKRELELWDNLNKKTKTLGFLGNETTAKIFNIFGVNFAFPSYEKSFRFASNHILTRAELTGHVDSDRKKIFSALRNGNFYFAFDNIGDPKGFAAYLSEGQRRILIGESTPYSDQSILHVELPEDLKVPVMVEVWKNGQIFYKSRDTKSVIKIDGPGFYRVVVLVQPKLPFPDTQRWLGWIYSNPIYVY